MARVLQWNKADNNHDPRDRLNAWPPLRELQNGPGTRPRKAGYAIATALTTGSKKAFLTACGESPYTIVRQPSRTQKLMPAPSMAGGAHGVSVLARKVICDVRIT